MVKCAECGFLAARNITTRELEEAEETFREKGITPLIGQLQGRPMARHESLPLCFARAYNLLDEFKEFAGKDNPDYTSVHFVIYEERECEAFTEWQQGFTPREHKDMLDQQKWRAWQEERRRNDRKWNIIVVMASAGGFSLLGALIARGCI